MRGKYIAVEGIEGAGKSTQAMLLANKIDALYVREPGNTVLGEKVREILLNPVLNGKICGLSEVALFGAARAQLVEELIKPTLLSGRHVVSDRSWLSSAAYQQARNIPLATIITVNEEMLGDYFNHDLDIILDGDPTLLMKRKSAAGDKLDRIELESMEFHHAVRNNFLQLSSRVGTVVINALQHKEAVTNEISNSVFERLKIRSNHDKQD